MNKKSDLMTPIAIVVAGAVIALALYFALSDKKAPNTPQEQANQKIEIRDVQKDDLVKGAKNPKITIVEYSDTECPFCKQFHETMNKVIENYGDKVRWIYRHLPLDQLHKKARPEAEAVECAVKIAGPEKGFAYLDRLMEITTSNDGLDLAELPKIAAYVGGIDANKFQKCIDNRETKDDVQKDYEEAINKAGARGTPHNVIIIEGMDEPIAVPGGLPYEQMEELIKQVLEGKLQTN